MLHIFSAIVTLFTFSKGKKEEVKKEIQEEKKREMVEVVDLEDYPSTEITELVLYPCIGVQGIPIQKAKLTKTGFEYDRCWFCIQKVSEGKWEQVGIKKCKEMGKLSCRIEDDKYLLITYPGVEKDLKLDMKFNFDSKETYDAYNDYDNKIVCYSVGKEAEEWFTKACGRPLILVRSPTLPPIATFNVEHKLTDNYKDYAMNPGHGDAPFHFISEKSMDDLRERVNDPNVNVTRVQFKANMVVKGNIPYEEDNMKELIIKGKDSNPVKQTSYNYKKTEFNENGEPFATLRKYRSYGADGTPFGMYAAVDTEGIISVGDTVTYTKKRSTPIVFD